MLKRLISGTLSAIICMTSIVPNHLSNYVRREAKAITKEVGDYDIKATNSLGNYIKGMSAKNDITSSLTQGFDSSRFQITSLEFDCETGVVQIASTQPSEAKIVVSFINDETSENILSFETNVEAGQLINSEVKVDSSKLPQYYLVKAQLFDNMNRPVGKTYTLSRFTKEVQKIIATDITAFDNEQVINLDDDDTTNFIVLSNDTVKAESSEEQNVLVSADYNNNIFVFENADETITSLEKGESLFIQPDEENIIALNVEKIEKHGNAVTVSGNDEIDDMFEFIKIESDGDVKRAKIDTSAADDGVVFPDIDENGNVIVKEDGSFNFEYEMPQYEIELSYSRSKEISIDALLSSNSNDDSDSKDFRPHDPYDDTEIDKSAKFSGSITFSVNFNLYKTFTTTDIECVIKITPSISFEGGVSIYNYTDKDTIPSVRSLAATIAEIIIPTSVPLVDLVLSPRIFCEISGKISATVKWDNIIGFAYKDGEFINKTKLFSPENFGGDFKLEGEIYAGLELKLYAEVISKKIASFGFDVKAGIRVTTDADITKLYELLKSKNTPQEKVILSSDKGDSYHACKFCMKFTTDFVIKCDLELHILGKDSEKNLLELAVNLPFLNAYLSFENGFGFGECDYKRYMVKFHDLTGSDNDFLPAVITLGDKKIRVSSKDTIFYCLPGSYSYDVSYNEESLRSGSITVSNAPLYISYLQGPGGEVTTGEPNMHEENSNHNEENSNHEFEELSLPELSFENNQTIIEAGKLGDHITYTLYPDGYLYIFGHGDMYKKDRKLYMHGSGGYTISSPFNNSSIIKKVIIENDGNEEDGGVITSIGEATFYECENLKTINMPQTIQHIDLYAFMNCKSLYKVTYDEYDYENDKIIKNEIPDGKIIMPRDLNSIDSYAFYGCNSIEEIIISDTVNKIGLKAFAYCQSLKKAIIKGGSEEIGSHIFAGCASLNEITLPFAGFSANAVDAPESRSQILNYFDNYKGYSDNYKDSYSYDDRYYKVKSFTDDNIIIHIPKSLKKITILGGNRIPTYAFRGLSGIETIDIPDTITDIGEYAFFGCVSMTNVPIPQSTESIGYRAFDCCRAAKFENLVFADNLTFISEYAFNDCIGLTSVEVPETVTKIGERAFNNCTSLEKAIIKGGSEKIGKNIFAGCTSLAEVTLPFAEFSADKANNSRIVSCISDYFDNDVLKSLQKIEILGGSRISDCAFANLNSVKYITIPETVTEIGKRAFEGCSSMINNPISSKITGIGDNAFRNCTNANFNDLELPNNLTYIGYSAFSGCNGIINVTVPESVKTIGGNAFDSCNSLKKAIIYGGTDEICNNVFNNCTSLENVIIHESAKKIGSYIFTNCTSLKTAVIKGGINGIGLNIFNGCTSIAEITLPFAGFSADNADDPKVVSEISSYFSLKGTDEEYYISTNKSGGKIYIPKTLRKITVIGGKRISNFAFYNLGNIETIVIPDSITEIGNQAFDGCSSMINNPIHSNITFIGDDAFKNCTNANFNDLKLPNNLTYLGYFAFSGCNGIINVTVPESVKSICANAFDNCKSLKSLSLPFAGNSLELANKDGSTYRLSDLFFEGSGKDFYKIEEKSGWTIWIPKSLTTVSISGGQKIPKLTFYGMASIKDVYLPKSINIIDDYAFNGCTGIKNVFYPGTRKEWEKNVTIGINNEEINGKIRFIDDNANHDTTSTTATPVITTMTTTTNTTNDVTIKNTAVSINITTEAITTPMTTITDTSTTTTDVTIKTTADSANTSIATTTPTTSITPETNITTTTTEISEITETSTTTSAKMISGTTSTIYETIKTYTTSYTTTVSQTTSTIITTEFIDKETEIELGDASGDGKVDAVDAGIILMIYAKNSTSNPIILSPDQKLAYDVNEDGKVNALDASYILCYYAYISVSSNEPISLKNFMLKKE